VAAARPATGMSGTGGKAQLPVTGRRAGLPGRQPRTPRGRASGAAPLTETRRRGGPNPWHAATVATASPAGQSATVQLPGQQDLAVLMQRTMGEAAPVTATQFSRLLEQMDPARTGQGEEGDALEGLGRSHAASSSAATPLTA